MITVAGISPSLDLTYSVEALTPGEIQRTSEVVHCAGGKPLNMARAAATLGGSVRVVAILGGRTGQLLADELSRSGVAVSVVETPRATRICVSIAAADTGQLTEVYQNAAPIPDEVWRTFRSQLAATLEAEPGWVSISGGAPSGLDDAALAGLVGLAHHRGSRVAVDTYGPALAAAVDVRPDLVKVNRVEAAALLGAAPDADLVEMATRIHERTGELVVLTDGVHGVALVNGRHRLRATLPGVIGRFAVGSGDAFLGGLVRELDRGAELPEGLRTAVAAGVANAGTPGPANFSRAEVDRLRSQVRMQAADA